MHKQTFGRKLPRNSRGALLQETRYCVSIPSEFRSLRLSLSFPLNFTSPRSRKSEVRERALTYLLTYLLAQPPTYPSIDLPFVVWR